MSIQIKSLTVGTPTKDTSQSALNDSFNVIPTANEVYTLYAAPNVTTPLPDKKATIVKSIRLANLKSQTVSLSLFFNRPNSIGLNRRRLLGPQNIAINSLSSYIDDSEITMEPGDSIQAIVITSVSNAIQYVISGVERDVT